MANLLLKRMVNCYETLTTCGGLGYSRGPGDIISYRTTCEGGPMSYQHRGKEPGRPGRTAGKLRRSNWRPRVQRALLSSVAHPAQVLLSGCLLGLLVSVPAICRRCRGRKRNRKVSRCHGRLIICGHLFPGEWWQWRIRRLSRQWRRLRRDRLSRLRGQVRCRRFSRQRRQWRCRRLTWLLRQRRSLNLRCLVLQIDIDRISLFESLVIETWQLAEVI